MKAHSLVECISKPENLAATLGLAQCPVVGETYEVRHVKRCRCKKHNNVILQEMEGFWHEKHFKEIQPPVYNVRSTVDEMIEEVAVCEPVEELV